MFLATMMAVTRPYTSKELAEKSLVKKLLENDNVLIRSLPDKELDAWTVCLLNGQHDLALAVWNTYARTNMIGGTLYMAEVTECEVDGRFP